MKKLSLIMLCSTFFATAFANVHTGWVKIIAPNHSKVIATSPSDYDLHFTQLPAILFKANYKATTNQAGAGSGNIEVAGSDYACAFNIFYENGDWKSIVLGKSYNAECKSRYDANHHILYLKAWH